MFLKLSALVALLPLVSALTVDTPTNVHSSGPVTLTWTTSAGDPDTFSFELVNTDVFHNAFAIANNVQPGLQALNVSLPVVPAGPGYTLQAVNITNINQVFAESGSFTIEDAVSTTSSSALSTSASSASSVSGASVTTPVGASSTSGFGTIITPSGTSAASNTASGTNSASSSSDSAAPTTFNGNGAATIGHGSWAAMALAAMAGAAVAL